MFYPVECVTHPLNKGIKLKKKNSANCWLLAEEIGNMPVLEDIG